VAKRKRVSSVLTLQALNLNRQFKWGQRVIYQASLAGMHTIPRLVPRVR